MRELLAAGANPDQPDGEGYKAVGAAAEYGHVQTVRALLVGGADVNGQNTKVGRPRAAGAGTCARVRAREAPCAALRDTACPISTG